MGEVGFDSLYWYPAASGFTATSPVTLAISASKLSDVLWSARAPYNADRADTLKTPGKPERRPCMNNSPGRGSSVHQNSVLSTVKWVNPNAMQCALHGKLRTLGTSGWRAPAAKNTQQKKSLPPLEMIRFGQRTNPCHKVSYMPLDPTSPGP